MVKTLSALLLCVFSITGATITNLSIGTTANDNAGDSLRSAFVKINSNFAYVVSLIGTTNKVDTSSGKATNLTVKTALVLPDVNPNSFLVSGPTNSVTHSTIDINSLTPTVQVDTLADLVQLAIPTVSTHFTALVSGRTTKNDGNGGLFCYDSTSSETTNLGTILKPSSTTGRWKRTIAGPIVASWFGVDGTGSASDIAANASLTNYMSGKTNLVVIGQRNIVMPQAITGRGPLVMGHGTTTDPVLVFGYNHNPDYSVQVSGEPAFAWVIEGNYDNDPLGGNPKMEMYGQFLPSTGWNGSNQVRWIMTQMDRVTGLPTATLLSGGSSVSLNINDGTGTTDQKSTGKLKLLVEPLQTTSFTPLQISNAVPNILLSPSGTNPFGIFWNKGPGATNRWALESNPYEPGSNNLGSDLSLFSFAADGVTVLWSPLRVFRGTGRMVLGGVDSAEPSGAIVQINNTASQALGLKATADVAMMTWQSSDALNPAQLVLNHTIYSNNLSSFYFQSQESGIDYRPISLNPNGGNVGIGHKLPLSALQVSADSELEPPDQIRVTTLNTNQQLLIGYKKTGDYGSIQVLKAGAGYMPLALQHSGSDGRVGIGMTNPLAKLEVKGSGANLNGILKLTSTSTNEVGPVAQIGTYNFASQDGNGALYIAWGMRWNPATGFVRDFTTTSNYLPWIKFGQDSKVSIGGAVTNLTSNGSPSLNTVLTVDMTTASVGVGTVGTLKSPFNVPGLPTYANNAAAISGGLTNPGAFYRTGADPDIVCVVH